MDTKQTKGKILRGTIVSDKMDKTLVVKVSRYVKHDKYQKYQKTDKRYKVHDPENKWKGKVGEKVEIMETRPISKDKHFVVLG